MFGGINVQITPGGTTKFLRADGQFATPSSGVAGSNTQVQYNNAGSFSGSSNLVFDGTDLIIGGTDVGACLNVSTSNPTKTVVNVRQYSNAANAYALLQISNDGSPYIGLSQLSSGFSTNGLLSANLSLLQNSGADLLVCTLSTKDVIIATDGNTNVNKERLRCDSVGNVSIGNAAIATNATDGFLYIPTCAGAPTGTPTTKTGRAAIVYDTTNNKLCVYNGAWKTVTLA